AAYNRQRSLGVSADWRAENRPWDLIRFIPAWESESFSSSALGIPGTLSSCPGGGFLFGAFRGPLWVRELDRSAHSGRYAVLAAQYTAHGLGLPCPPGAAAAFDRGEGAVDSQHVCGARLGRLEFGDAGPALYAYQGSWASGRAGAIHI